MKVSVHAIRLNHDSASAEQARIAEWLQAVPAERAARIMRFRRWEDQWRSLAGDLLVRAVLLGELGLTHDQLQSTRNSYGKPSLIGGEFEYNVSHAGSWVVAAFHSASVGIDVEKIGEADMQVAESMFSRRELDALLSLEGEARDRYFYKLWTGKESYIKAVGMGLSIPLDSFSIIPGEKPDTMQVIAEKKLLEKPEQGHERWYLKQFQLDPAYKLTVCAAAPEWPEDGVQVWTAEGLG